MSATRDPAPPAWAELPLRKNRDFLLLWTGAGFATLGVQLTFVVYPLLVIWHSDSATAAGLVTAAAVLPHLVVQLPAGAFVDRFDRRRLMITCDTGCIVATASVLVAVYLDIIWLPHLMLAAFVHGSLGICYELAERTAVPHLVHETQVAKALGQNEARKRAVGMVSDPLGTLAFSFVRWVPFLLTTVAHVVSLLELVLIRQRFQAERARRSGDALRTEIVEGVRWLWAQYFLRTAMLLIAGSNLVFAGIVLTLIVIVREAGQEPFVVGVVLAVGGLGGVLGALTAPWWRERATMRTLLPACLIMWTLSIGPLAFVTDPVLLGCLFAANGYVGGMCNAVGYVYAVQVTPDVVLGRAMSVMMVLGSGANFLGVLVAGVALDDWGVATTVAVMSATMAGLAVIGLLHPAVRDVANHPGGGWPGTPPQESSSARESAADVGAAGTPPTGPTGNGGGGGRGR